MNDRILDDKSLQQEWLRFSKKEKITDAQLEQFKCYLALLKEWNAKFNLTTIIQPKPIIKYHFQDSLRIGDFVDFTKISSIADVGTGAGFPGLALKIRYPHLKVVLIEVNNKKISFLNTIIEQLGLDNIEVYSLDWRTFLRKTEYEIDLFLARASLLPDELMRMFKPASPYKNTTLIYWAAQNWAPSDKEKPYVVKEEKYGIGDRERKFIFFRLSNI